MNRVFIIALLFLSIFPAHALAPLSKAIQSWQPIQLAAMKSFVTRCDEESMGKEFYNRFREIQEIRDARQFTYAGMAITDWGELEDKVYGKIDSWNSSGIAIANLNSSILPDPLKEKFKLLFAAMDRVGQATPARGDLEILDKYGISYSPIDDGYHIGHPVALSCEDLDGDGTDEIIFSEGNVAAGQYRVSTHLFREDFESILSLGTIELGENRDFFHIELEDVTGDGLKEIMIFANYKYMGTSNHPIYLGIYKIIDGKIQRIWFEQILFASKCNGTQYETAVQFETRGKIRMRIYDNRWEFSPGFNGDFCYLVSALGKEISYRWDGSRYISAEEKTIIREEITEKDRH